MAPGSVESEKTAKQIRLTGWLDIMKNSDQISLGYTDEGSEKSFHILGVALWML